jgi:hypothetical protein
MTIARRSVFSAVLVLVILAATASSQEKGKPSDKPKLDIRVTLRFSVEEFDPKDPKDSFVECVVRNQSAAAVKVPTVYTYGAGYEQEMILKGKHQRGWDLSLINWDKEAKPVHALLEPGKELAIFKGSLRKLLLPEGNRHIWNWVA